MSTLLAPPSRTATAWRNALPEMYARNVEDGLLATLEGLAVDVRDAVVAKLELAMRSGVYDPATLATITDVVVADVVA